MRIGIAITLAAFAAAGCGAAGGGSSSSGGGGGGGTTNTTEVVAAGLAALAGAVQANATGSGAISQRFRSENFKFSRIAFLFDWFGYLRRADATVTTCNSPVANDSCVSSGVGAKSASYTSCTASGGNGYSGTTQLIFTSTTCLMTTVGNQATRSVDITRTGISGTSVTTSSSSHTDYRGNVISGGSVIQTTNTSTPTYSLNILGIHKERENGAGTELWDISVRTTSAMTITGNLTSSTRALSGGTLEVANNTSSLVAIFVPDGSITFDDTGTCCHPTSGSFDVIYSGTVSGTGTVDYSSTCGRATLTLSGSSTSVTLHGCE
jgi:hypothetical protein